jgi:hypothetical protein
MQIDVLANLWYRAEILPENWKGKSMDFAKFGMGIAALSGTIGINKLR